MIILIFAFGTLVAAGVPVLIGGVSVLTALAALYFIAGVYDMSVFTLTLSTMLGLGLGIDYALFFVSRFREELEDYPTAEAVPRTVATAGRSIFFSGTAVLIGLSGLLFFPFMFMRSIGVAGVVVVFVSVLRGADASAGAPGRPRTEDEHARDQAPRDGGGRLLGQERRGRDAPSGAVILLGAVSPPLLYPVTHMKVGIPEASVLPQEYESRAGDDILKQNFEYAALYPMEIVASVEEDPLSAEAWKTPESSARASVERMASRVSRASTPWWTAAAKVRGKCGRSPRGGTGRSASKNGRSGAAADRRADRRRAG